MDDRRRDDQVDRRTPGEKHGWLRIDRYEAIHSGALERHRFVVEDRTRFARGPDERRGAPSITLIGALVCEAGIVIEVEKRLALRTRRRGGEEVRTYFYNYNAYLPGRGNILRYDNAHLGAPDEYHRHEYDLATGVESSRTLLTREEFPTLIEVIDEVQRIARRAGLI